MMFARWRYRGRHRGYFLDCYRSVDAFAEAEELSARWCAIIDADIRRDLAAAHRAQIDAILPPLRPNVVGQVLVRDYVLDAAEAPLWVPLGHEPTIVFDPPVPVPSGVNLHQFVDELIAQAPDEVLLAWPHVTIKLWLPPGDEVDDDELACQARLMGMAGA